MRDEIAVCRKARRQQGLLVAETGGRLGYGIRQGCRVGLGMEIDGELELNVPTVADPERQGIAGFGQVGKAWVQHSQRKQDRSAVDDGGQRDQASLLRRSVPAFEELLHRGATRPDYGRSLLDLAMVPKMAVLDPINTSQRWCLKRLRSRSKGDMSSRAMPRYWSGVSFALGARKMRS